MLDFGEGDPSKYLLQITQNWDFFFFNCQFRLAFATLRILISWLQYFLIRVGGKCWECWTHPYWTSVLMHSQHHFWWDKFILRLYFLCHGIFTYSSSNLTAPTSKTLLDVCKRKVWNSIMQIDSIRASVLKGPTRRCLCIPSVHERAPSNPMHVSSTLVIIFTWTVHIPAGMLHET